MKILHTADWHVGRTLRNRSRADEHRDVLREIAGIAVEEQVDLVIVAGDLFDSASPTAESEQIVYAALLDLAATGAEVVIIAGNHDHPRRLHAVSPILNRLQIRVGAEVAPAHEGGVIQVKTKSGQVASLVLVPFISKRTAFSAKHFMDSEGAEQVQRYQDQCAKIVRALCKDLSPDHVSIAIAHVAVLGGKLGGGERLAHSIDEYYVPHHIFPIHLSYVALGHLHAPQQIPAGLPMWYCGSPLQLDFGERNVRNEVLIVEANPGEPAEVRHRLLQSGRRLTQLRGTMAELRPQVAQVGEDYVKIIVTEPGRVGLADDVRELFPNAVEVLVDHPVDERPTERLDFDKLNPDDLFRAYLQEINQLDEGVMHAFTSLMERQDAPA